MFRAMTKDGREVFGWLLKKHYYNCIKKDYEQFEIQSIKKINDEYYNIVDSVIPETIAMKTGQLDKEEKDIYGSFELEGFGMTRGGDKCYDDANEQESIIQFIDGAFCMVDIENENISPLCGFGCNMFLGIIGKQYEENK